MRDIYFDQNYGKLYEAAENGVAVNFHHESKLGSIRHQFIKRKIPSELTAGENWYDLVTPYGYGGPYIERSNEEDKQALLLEFQTEFENYCMKNNIVSEFIRFHPILSNAADFETVYEIHADRKTVGTALDGLENPMRNELTKECRKKIRNVLNAGIGFRVTEDPENLEEFKRVYNATMQRNHAQDYYHFDDEYYENCLNYFKSNMILVEAIYEGQVIAATMCFVANKIIHVHLSGTDSAFLHLSPAYVLKYAVILWGIEHGCTLVHYGGGRTSSPQDSLYTFKKKFGKRQFDFCIGKKVWNQSVYDRLCRGINTDDHTDFFPAYRMARS